MNTHEPMAEQALPPGLRTPHSALRTPHSHAFTLVEMIVVTGIIAVLAALIFPVTAAVRKARDLKRAQTELTQVVHAIEGYKDKLGHYPPDNASGDPQRGLHSQLFYELRGTTAVKDSSGTVTSFNLLDGSTSIPQGAVKTAFGTDGFVNCTRGAGDEAQPAQKFLPDLKGGQYFDMSTNGVTFRALGCSFDGLNVVRDASGNKVFPPFSPWYYNYSSPTNGSAPYDLCVDIQVGSKIYRVSNWSTTPQVLQ